MPLEDSFQPDPRLSLDPESIPLPPSPITMASFGPPSSPSLPPSLPSEQAANQRGATPLWGISEESNDAIAASFTSGTGTILTGQLPDLITTYQVDQGVVLFTAQVYNSIVGSCLSHPDFSLGPTDLAAFFNLNAQTTPSDELDASESFDSVAPSTPSSKSARRQSRRVSDRIKSPSDSSDTSDEDLQTDEDKSGSNKVALDPAFQRAQSEDIHLHRKVSAATMLSPTGSNGGGMRQPFPGGSPSLASTPEIAPISRRTKTLSESSLRYNEDGPLSARLRSEQAGPTYSGMGFQKPMSMHHRRRVSRDISGHSADDMSSTDVSTAAKYTRSVSTSSVPSSRGRSESPASPMVDQTSFHAGFKSPPRELALDDDSFLLNSDRSEEPDPFDLNDNRLLPPDNRNPRIGKLSTASSSSLTLQHDQVQELKRQIADLERKRKEAERAVAAMGQDNDQLLADMQDRLDEAHEELTVRKKEQAEYKGKDRAHAMVVKNLEGEIDILKRQLDETRNSHAEAQKRHQASIDQSSKLADYLKEREEAAEELVKQNEDCEHEILRLQAQITAFESQLDRQQREFEDGEIAKTELVKQKEANLELQAENELLKRNHMPQALSPDLAGRLGVPGGSAGPSTFSRNLGAEFARRLEDDDEMEPGILEETVTTRVVRRHSRMQSRALSDPNGLFEPQEEDTVEENVREYVEVGTDPDPVLSAPHSPSPPAYSPTEPQPVNPLAVLEQAHPPREPSTGSTVDEDDDDYKNLVRNIGIRCKLYEEELERKRLSGEKLSSRLSRRRSQTFSGSSAKERGEGWRWDSAFSLGAAGCAFAMGVMVGGMWLSGSAPSQRDIDLFTKVNTLALAAGWYGEGLFPEAMMRNALDQGARRLFVPT